MYEEARVVACTVTPVLGSKVDREMNPYSALAAQPSWTDELPVQWETLTETIKVKRQGETRVSMLDLHTYAHTHGSTCTCVNTTHTGSTYAKSWAGINLTHMFYSIQHTIITLGLSVCSRNQWKAFSFFFTCYAYKMHKILIYIYIYKNSIKMIKVLVFWWAPWNHSCSL